MEEFIKIPVFPLAIFPLPGELVPLHIFEPRYRQLLEDAETNDMSFGIFFNHASNISRLGSVVKLESVIKRYPGGESDIVVKCTDLFEMNTLFRTHRDKLYPGGEVRFWNVDGGQFVNSRLSEAFVNYLALIKITRRGEDFSAYHIATELNLDAEERMKFVSLDETKKELFLLTRLKYQTLLLAEADKAKDVFHLN